jgi:GNAT superfamily N-acetyltransferase
VEQPVVEFRRLGRTELSHVIEIDRRERIDLLYAQHGTRLVARHGNWSASARDPVGHGEHSVEAQVHALQHYVDDGGIALGVLSGGRLVGTGVVVPHLRPGIAPLAFLHVSAPLRATGIGSRLSEQLEKIARTVGDNHMVVSATPSENTVRFYLGRGFEPMAQPLAELFELESEDVHMRKVLRAWLRMSGRCFRAVSPITRFVPERSAKSGESRDERL